MLQTSLLCSRSASFLCFTAQHVGPLCTLVAMQYLIRHNTRQGVALVLLHPIAVIRPNHCDNFEEERSAKLNVERLEPTESQLLGQLITSALVYCRTVDLGGGTSTK